MQVNLFTKCNPHRIYFNNIAEKTFIHIVSGKLVVRSEKESLVSVVHEHFLKNNIDISSIGDINRVYEMIKSIPEIDGQKSKARRSFANKYDGLTNNKDISDLWSETSEQDLSTIKFKASTIKNGYILVDHREPLSLQTMMYNCQIDSVDVAQLPLGDIVVGFKDQSCELIIERKRIKDANYGITNENHHAHDQIERYYQYVQEKAEQGIHVKVIWIFENEDERTLYNSLNLAKQVDGWVNLSIAISDQYIATSFNLVHTAYLVTKFAQGFLERKLTYPVKVNGQRIDKEKPHKLRKAIVVDKEDRGILRASASIAATLALMPGIPTNIAKELASTNMSINQITSMTFEQIKAIKGVGDKRANEIFSMFNDAF